MNRIFTFATLLIAAALPAQGPDPLIYVSSQATYAHTLFEQCQYDQALDWMQRAIAQLRGFRSSDPRQRDTAAALLARLEIERDQLRRRRKQLRAAGLSVLEQRWQVEQSAALKQLADNIAAQQALYEAFREGEEQNRKARRALLESYRTLTQLLEQQLRLNEEKRRLWLDYYDALGQLVEARQPPAAAPKTPKAKERK